MLGNDKDGPDECKQDFASNCTLGRYVAAFSYYFADVHQHFVALLLRRTQLTVFIFLQLQTLLSMLDHQIPEMQRVPLEELCLQVKAILSPSPVVSSLASYL